MGHGARAARRRYAALALLSGAVALGTSATPARAQIRASEIGSVSQVVDGTKLTLTYSRPRARGRQTLFGTKAVHWDEVWTPGANYATTLETSKAIKLDGHDVPKGKYSIWLVVREKGAWTFVLDPNDRIYHMNPPDSSAKQVRFPVKTTDAPFTDVLTWSFPELRADGGLLSFTWERKRIDVRFEVEPSLSPIIAATDAQPFVGRYEFADTAKNGKVTNGALVVLYDDGARTMKAEWVPYDNYMKRFAMIRIAPDWFVPGVYDENGKIYEVYRPEMIFQFARAGGRITSVDLRNENDSLEMRATRKP